MKHVMIFSGNVSRKVTWDQAIVYLHTIKGGDSIATLRKHGITLVPFNGSTITLSVLPE